MAVIGWPLTIISVAVVPVVISVSIDSVNKILENLVITDYDSQLRAYEILSHMISIYKPPYNLRVHRDLSFSIYFQFIYNF
jgi:hypothetical protein